MRVKSININQATFFVDFSVTTSELGVFFLQLEYRDALFTDTCKKSSHVLNFLLCEKAHKEKRSEKILNN